MSNPYGYTPGFGPGSLYGPIGNGGKVTPTNPFGAGNTVAPTDINGILTNALNTLRNLLPGAATVPASPSPFALPTGTSPTADTGGVPNGSGAPLAINSKVTVNTNLENLFISLFFYSLLAIGIAALVWPQQTNSVIAAGAKKATEALLA